jgi:hypothetical protein
VPDYLVEMYMGRSAADELAQLAGHARAAAEGLTASGTAVHYRGTIAAAEDETCFHLYTGASAAAVTDAARRAAIPIVRIVKAVHLPGDRAGLRAGPRRPRRPGRGHRR